MTILTRSAFAGALAALITVTAAGPVFALDGKALYTAKGCTGCHGATGNEPTTPQYPKVSGQSKAYIVQQMQDIKSGARDNAQSRVMRPMVAQLSTEEIEAIAEYLSEQPCE